MMSFIKKLDRPLLLQIGFLLVVIWLCYLPALDSFFVADDIWQVNFAHKVFDGRTELIWRNFTSNYLQLPSFDFYRPLLGFTFLLDYLLWHAQALGYHITNIVLYSAITILLFFLMRTLTKGWPSFNSSWTAFLTALLFAVSPLHCEDVTWISGRADILSAPFYLLSLYWIVRSHQEKKAKFYWLALAGFWFAILSKEIAIGLPAVIAAYYFFWSEEERFSELFERPKPVESEVTDASSDETKENAVTAKKAVTAAQIAYAKRALKKGKKKRRRKAQDAGVDAEANGEVEAGGDRDPEDRMSAPQAKNGDDPHDEGTKEDDSTSRLAAAASGRQRPRRTFISRLLFALKMSAPFLVSALIYLGIRYKALGTLVGGYGGMMGGALGRHLLLRWLDPVNFERILLPFPKSITPDNMFPQWITLICLIVCLLIVLLRFLVKSNPGRWFAFLCVWMVTSVLPLAKLWGIGMELETSRLLFFFSMAYSALWPVLMFHPPTSKERVPAVANRSLGYVSIFAVAIMSMTFAWGTFSTNCLWLAAGQELRKIWQDTVELSRKLGDNEKVIVLGIPKDYKGAHLNFNGSTFHHMLRPPFVQTPLSSRVITFEPFIVGPYEVINSERLKTLMQMPNIKGPYVWQRKKLAFEPMKLGGATGLGEEINLPFHPIADSPIGNSAWRFDGKGTAELKGQGILLHDTEDGSALKIDKLNINPLEADFLEFEIKAKLRPGDERALVPMAIGWNSLSVDTSRSDWAVVALHVDKLSDFSKFRLQVGHYWQWYSAGTIKSLVMRLFDAEEIQIKDVRLRKRDQLIPFLGMKDLLPLNSGEYLIGDKPLFILFDGTPIPEARSVEIEVTKPNYFFDNYLMGTDETAVNHRLSVPLAKGATLLKPSLFAQPAYYEIRLRALDATGKPVGTWSEYLTVLKMGGGLDTYLF